MPEANTPKTSVCAPFIKLYKIMLRFALGPLVLEILAPAEGFGLRQRHFLAFGQKRAYYAVLANFWQFLVSSSHLGNF